MMKDLLIQLDIALKQSTDMLGLAKEGQWEQLENLQQQHIALIQQIASADVTKYDAEKIRILANKIQYTDKQTEALVEANKRKIVQQKQQQKKVDNMKKALDVFK